MEHSLRVEDGILVAATSGAADVSGWAQLYEAIHGEPGFARGMPILIDHTALDPSGLTGDDARAIGEIVSDFQARGIPSRIAVVAPKASLFGLARIAQSRIDVGGARIFYERGPAEDWLRS